MYETGGGFRKFVPIVASLAFLMLGIGYIGGGHLLTSAVSVVVSFLILFFSFPVFSGRLVRRIVLSLRGKEKQTSQAWR